MSGNMRTNHKARIQAFDILQKWKGDGVPRKKIIKSIHGEFGIPVCALYSWYSGKYVPYGRRGKVLDSPEILYVLGALLGDGCLYKYKETYNYLILVGDKNFTQKYAKKLTICIGRKSKPCIDRSKGVWFVRCNNYELGVLFEKSKKEAGYLQKVISSSDKAYKLLFVEGFFDAEGCVKVIKEASRKTPKICLDITNTDKKPLDIIKKILEEVLGIEAKYSVQKGGTGKDGSHRKTTYHLRVYKKIYIREFFEQISTTKLTDKKRALLQNWLSV